MKFKEIEELLGQLDKNALVRLIAKMVDKNSDLYSWLQAAIPTTSAKPQFARSRRKRKTEVSKTEYKRQIQSILHSLRGYRMSEAYWMMGGMVNQLDHVRDTAYEFSEHPSGCDITRRSVVPIGDDIQIHSPLLFPRRPSLSRPQFGDAEIAEMGVFGLIVR
ncbi:MAG: hypothetical protein WA109_09375 [Bellilinea sp.]